MRAWILVIAGALTLAALPAEADRGHHRAYHHRHVGFGLSYGYPYYYRPYSAFYPSAYYGFGIDVTPRYRTRRVRAERSEPQTRKLYVYPAGGPSTEHLAEDRYECHVCAADNTGFDPTLGAGSAREATEYGRAFTACMEGRDYVVK
jgi:hypothetical protein